MSDLTVVPAAPVTPAGRAESSRRPKRHPRALVGLLASLLVVMSMATYAFPGPASASSTLATRCSGVALRTSASSTATLKVRLGANVRVTALTSLSGGRWRTSCAGVSKTGSTWFRISAIGSKSVKSLYGVSYLYAASSLFKTVVVPATVYTACGSTLLRASPSTSGAIKAQQPMGAKLVVYGAVSGTSWSVACPRSTSGTAWYRVTTVNGTSVSTLYGVSYVYVASGTTSSTQPAVTPTPTAKPSAPPPVPSDSPSASASASPTPTPSPTPTMTPIPIGTPPPVQANACFPPPSPVPTPVPTPTPVLPPTPTPDPSASPTDSPSPSPTPVPTPKPTPTPWSCVAGIDVSNWQGTIDWSQVATSGTRFAYMKASEGGWYVDPTYATNRLNANANGIVIGAYDFAQPSTTAGQAEAEADFFVNVAQPQIGDLTPVLDLETTNGLSVANLQTWVKKWLYRVYARTGLQATIYVSPSFWSSAMGGTTWFAQNGFRTLWLAHWTSATSPTVPASGWGGYDWTFWQWTSSGTVPGIVGRVDMDRFHYTDMTPYLIQ